ncbi:MAG: hypothetical protein M3Y27_31400, partial [Acidobacteriota bacterium]|nr:hypothetical protein [Acidobacteriota bacterium]
VVPSQAGTLIWSSLGGASNRDSSTYNPKTDLYYVNVKEMGRSIARATPNTGPARNSTAAAKLTIRARMHTAPSERSK